VIPDPPPMLADITLGDSPAPQGDTAMTPRAHAITAPGPAPAAAACPVAALARRFTQVQDHDREISQADRDDASKRYHLDRLGLELIDASDQLAAAAEWSAPQSAEGIYFQLLCILSETRELGDVNMDSFERVRVLRKIARLGALALNGLEAIGGFDGADYGKRHKTTNMDGFETAMKLATA
jgi:hypothetical protein